MGYKKARNEWYFWMAANSFVVYATAHQFSEHELLQICSGPSPMTARFRLIERLQLEFALRRMATIDSRLKQSIITLLARELVA